MNSPTTDESQPTLLAALEAIFGAGARVAVLRVFMLDPYRAYYQRQLEAATGLPIRAVQRELERFSQMGLLYRRTEGNRSYYQVDTAFALYPELRSMILKAADEADLLRAALAEDRAVRLAFLTGERSRALVVSMPGKDVTPPPMHSIAVEVMPSDDFVRLLVERDARLEPFLGQGVDLLGRREDVIWRHIEAADYVVQKGAGVA